VTECEFGEVDIDETYYTKIECGLGRQSDVEDYFDVAFPDVTTPGNVPFAYTSYYQARFAQQSVSDTPITVITPGELIRFYQKYTIIKDLQYRQPVSRRLDVELQVVQLSAIFLAIALLLLLLIVLGLTQYGLFVIRHYNMVCSTPQSKLDWIIQSISPERQPAMDERSGPSSGVKTDCNQHPTELPNLRSRSCDFEMATYRKQKAASGYFKDFESPTFTGDMAETRHGDAQLFCSCGSDNMVRQEKRLSERQTIVTENVLPAPSRFR